MIIYGLFSLIVSLLSVLLAPLPNIPALPDSAAAFLDDAVGYISSGFSFLYAFVYAEVIVSLLNVSILVLLFYEGYQFVMWVLRKVPMFGIS